MLNRLVAKHVTENLQWFLDRHLKDYYGRRRESLLELSKQRDLKEAMYPAIDYILKACIGPEAQYPPSDMSLWHEYYSNLGVGQSRVFQQLLLIYLQLDLDSYLLVRERESTTGRQTRAKDRAELNYLQTTSDCLKALPKSFDFTKAVIRLSTGLWALDNDRPELWLPCLSDPSIDFTNYFETPKDLVQLIVGTLHCQNNPRMALYMGTIHRHESWGDNYDPLHAYLLIQSGQIDKALKYERMFQDQQNYREILSSFFELCLRLDVSKEVNYLTLSVDEEEAWNEHLDAQYSTTPTGGHSMGTNTNHSGQQQLLLSNQSLRANMANGHVRISLPKTPNSSMNQSGGGGSSKHPTPRNRSVHALRKMPSFNDSPARNTRSARKRKGDK